MITRRSREQTLLENKMGLDALWPLISEIYGGGHIVSLEVPHAEHSEFDVLDRASGIDWVQVLPDGSHRTWAARFEYRAKAEGRFTIRQKLPGGSLSTEMLKRTLALVDNRLLPNTTIQASFSGIPSAGGRPLRAATVSTAELYAWLLGEEFAAHADEWGRRRRTRASVGLESPPMSWWGLRTAWPEGTQYLYVTFELLAHAGLPSLRIHELHAHQDYFFDPVAMSL